MTVEEKPKQHSTRVQVANSAGGIIWFTGWLFTIAFANLIWWKALLALIIWPYYLGLVLR
jgi:hypothetical protein